MAAIGAGSTVTHPLTRWVLFTALAVVQVGLALNWVRPGPLVIDEVIYQWMMRSLLAGHPLTIDNSFEELPSPELGTFQMQTGATLTSQYPYGFAFLAAPFFDLFGLHGPFVLNALAFVAVLALTWRIGKTVLRDERLAWLGVGIFLFGTYAWEYSMAAWPQMTGLVASLGVFSLVLSSLEAGSARPARAVRLALLAGLVGGAGATIRLDTLFVVAAVLLPFAFAHPVRWREILALLLGMVPGLVFLSITNWLRWRNPSPLSYGYAGGIGELSQYVPLGVAGVLVVAGAWVLTRPRMRPAVTSQLHWLIFAALALATVVAILPPTRPLLLRFLRGLWALIVDLRHEPATFADGGRVTSWALLYQSGIKKALLQSCPWLPIVLVPLFLGRRDDANRQALLLLFLVPAVVIPIYAFFAWHGGLALNLRYFLPTLPFLSLLAADAIRRTRALATPKGLRNAGIAAATIAALYLLLPASHAVNNPGARASFVLDVPLVLAAVTAAFVALLAWDRERRSNRTPVDGAVLAASQVGAVPARRRRTANALLSMVAASLVWAGFLGLEYDATWSRDLRTTNLLHSVAVADRLEEGALFFAFYADSFATVKTLRPDVTVAFPRQDQHEDFQPLAEHWLARDRPVFAVLAPEDWQVLRTRGALAGLTLRVAAAGNPFPLIQVTRASESGGP